MMMNRDYGLGQLKGKKQNFKICLHSGRKKEWCFQNDPAFSMPDDLHNSTDEIVCCKKKQFNGYTNIVYL